MRFLLLVLKILISTSLLTHSSDIFASVNKNGKHHVKKALRKASVRPSIDVWERIRTGMQIQGMIPQQNVAVIPSVNKTKTVVKIESALTPSQKKTPDQKIAQNQNQEHKSLKAIKLDLSIPVSSVVSNDSPLIAKTSESPSVDDFILKKPKNAVIQSRFHTRLGFHPKLNQADSKIETDSAEHHAPMMVITAQKPTLKPETSASSVKNPKTKATLASATKNADAKEPSTAQAIVLTKEERIEKHLDWYSKHSDYLNRVAERAKPYIYHIVDGLAKNRLPVDLALLPIIESAYQPTAQSPKSAAGLWQFIPSTGLDFDLKQSDHYDERLDIEASTQAAIRYLSFLKRHYNGDWLLALAAYNCGQGAVDGAIGRNQAEGLATDFWSLHLPEETQEYVPRFLAVSSVFANPARYGLKLPAVRNEPYFIKVKVEQAFDVKYIAEKELSTIASLANLSYEQFTQLNPGYLNPVLSTEGPFTFLMPVANAGEFHRNLSSVAQLFEEIKTPEIKTFEIKTSENKISAMKTPSVSEVLNKSVNSDSDQSLLPVAVTSLNKLDLLNLPNAFLSIKLDDKKATPRVQDEISLKTNAADKDLLTENLVDNNETVALK
jgi:soluble lytic murein transglycosylase-like protein